ncbi:ATP-binding cassette domain-containing protein [Treponema sp. J25]|uniref:ABC transporter ATP-binding protein n=1 Tax=Treponema sp. J25 TaxID=2094121 RepID=UPI00104C4E61|nr:ATP-binding cassette domain-containing protein [Treponema sp. J25]TCW62432.1 ABC transporter ATP-binding protein [Treponema sp. J25]
MIELQQVSVIFNPGTQDERRALQEVNLTIQKGDFLTVIGSNGAGKSTLLNVIAGSISPVKGRILIEGKDRTGEAEFRRARVIGRVYQNPLAGTAAEMTVEDNLAIALKKGRKTLRLGLNTKIRSRLRDALAQLDMGLEHRMKENVSRLSGGQRQALTLLMAVLSSPAILLLDEHTAALDPANAEKVMSLTQHFAREYNLSVLMVTHDMAEALAIGNRLIMMDRGEIIYECQGEEKQHLTVDMLVERFRRLRHRDFAGDAALLG